ncbi:MAG TPA: AAA family ATPase, partial [Frankiaceae bacterium]|nr:AAA family ATPase [Frankiaceae bacterium]
MEAPGRLLKIGATRFRSLVNVDVPLGPLNVLVGPNNSGKSNLLDVIRFLSDSVHTDLRPALDQRGGFERVRFRDGNGKGAVSIRVKAVVARHSSSNAPDEYTLTFDQRQQRGTCGSSPGRSHSGSSATGALGAGSPSRDSAWSSPM